MEHFIGSIVIAIVCILGFVFIKRENEKRQLVILKDYGEEKMNQGEINRLKNLNKSSNLISFWIKLFLSLPFFLALAYMWAESFKQ